MCYVLRILASVRVAEVTIEPKCPFSLLMEDFILEKCTLCASWPIVAERRICLSSFFSIFFKTSRTDFLFFFSFLVVPGG
jgi:hypothetical protein